MGQFTEDFIFGTIVGIVIATITFYLFLRIESHILLRRTKKRVTKLARRGKEIITNPSAIMRTRPLTPSKNLNQETVHLDLKLTLELLEKYRQAPTPELKQEIREQLELHTHEGNTMLHEYLEHTEKPHHEIVDEILEIEPEILLEENEKGETALHIAEKHEHLEIAEELVHEKHFASHEERHHFLMHADHHGHNALHVIDHMWHMTHAGEEWHKKFEHLIEMLEQFPKEALFAKDDQNKHVFESLLGMNEAERKEFVEALMHKGLIHMEHGHLAIPGRLKQQLHIDTASSHHNLATLAELYVNSYPHYVHEGEHKGDKLKPKNIDKHHPEFKA